MKVSSPPFMLTTRFSVVPMSRVNGAGLMRSNRTRVPLAVAVKFSAPLPPLTSTVSMPSPPSLRSLPSPGFQIIRSLPRLAEDLVVAGAAGQHVVAVAAEQQVVAALAEQRVVAAPGRRAGRCREPPVRVSLPSPPKRFAAGRAPLVSSSEIVSLPACPKTWISVVLATVGVPPWTATAPPLTRIVPAASRQTTMVLSWASPITVKSPGRRRNVAVTAGRTRRSSSFEAGEFDRANAPRRSATARATVSDTTKLTLPHEHHLQSCRERRGSSEGSRKGSGYGSSTQDPT